MKKITLIMSAVLVALTLNAQDLRTLSSSKVQLTQKAITLNPQLELQSVVPSIKKAPKANFDPQPLQSSIPAYVAQQSGNGVGDIMWMGKIDSTETWANMRYMIYLYAVVNDSTLSPFIARGNWKATSLGDTVTCIFSMSTDMILYYGSQGDSATVDTYVNKGYYLNPGLYYAEVYGNNGSALTDNGIGVVFEIKSYDVAGFNLVVDEENLKATISWDELKLPSGYYYAVDISTGSESVVSNYATLNTDSVVIIHSPVTFDVEKGKTYNIYINVLENYNGKLYYGCDNWIDTSFTVGINYYEPKNLQANVLTGDLAGYVELSWEVDSASYAYYIALYDETGTAVSFGNNRNYLITYNLKDTIGLGAGAYNWVVAGLELGSDGYLNFSTDQIAGPAFTMPDVRAPQLVNAAATLSADFTEAVITVMSADDGTAQEDIVIELQDAEGSKVSLFTYISGYNYADTLTNLEQNKEYTYYISAKDQAGNQTAKADRLVVSFTTADGKAPTLLAPTTSDITAYSVKISVRATDNVSKDKLTVIVSTDSIGIDSIGALALESTMKYSGVIEGLTPETTYNLWVIAYDEAGNATAKAVPEFKTLAEEKTNENPVIGEISVQTTDTSAVVTIAITDDNTALADLNVVILDSTMAEIAYPELQATAPLFVATIGGLEPETEYSFVVYAYDTDQGYASKEFSFTTNPTTGLFDLRQDKHAVKVIENGQIYILRDGEKFNVLGAKIAK